MPLPYCLFLFAVKQESEYVVLKETSVKYEGNSLDFVWEDQGLELHIDDEALSPDTSSCDIHISAVSSTGLFQFPEGFELASGVYKIDCQCNFIKPVELIIEHNVEISTSKLCFAVASDESSPYNFYCEEEGEFEACYGAIKLSSFSFWTTLKEIVFGPSQYSINLYSIDTDLTKPNDKWRLYIVVAKSKPKLEKSAITTLSDSLRQKLCLRTSLHGEFDSSKEEIKFEPIIDRNLKITPLNPLCLKKGSVDNYSVGSIPPYVGLEVSNKKGKKEIILKINIRGLKGDNKDNFLTFTSFTPCKFMILQHHN